MNAWPQRLRPGQWHRRQLLLGCLLQGMLLRAHAEPQAPSEWPATALRTSLDRPIIEASAHWRVTYVDFWASWCAPCRLSFPWMARLHDRMGPRGLRLVAINLDRRAADADRFLAAFKPPFEIARDPEASLAERLAVAAMPTSMLVERSGRILWRHHGFRAIDGPDLERKIEAHIS
jgi:cytochrome c biogenesis protein CcmG/thiol:disulfide interchange protein DsbE